MLHSKVSAFCFAFLTLFTLTAIDLRLFCVYRVDFNELSGNGYKPTSEEAPASRPEQHAPDDPRNP